jgi:hypothetical protein
MTTAEVLRNDGDEAFNQLLSSIEGLTTEQSWGRLALQPGEYMHTEGSIYSNVMHVVGGKFMYGSAAYRGNEIRWTPLLDRLEAIWTDWEKAKALLFEAQEYWLDSWKDETDFGRIVKTNWGADWPSWKVIWTVTQHDSYHAGQIHLLRTTTVPSSVPPPSERELCEPYLHEYSR